MSDTKATTDTQPVAPPPAPPANVEPHHSPDVVESTQTDDGLSEASSSDEDYETVDLAESELYQVLSLFLNRTPEDDSVPDEPTENVTDVLAGLKNSVDTLNRVLTTLVTAATVSQTTRPPSTSVRRKVSKSSTKQ